MNKNLFALIALIGGMAVPANADVEVSGEKAIWRTLTLDIEGPESSETATPNPFTDYRLDVEFSKGKNKYVVPGYFAACGQAAVNSCDSGNVWRAHFTPNEAGAWKYRVSFRAGDRIILGGKGKGIFGLDGLKGKVDIAAPAEGSTDVRDQGRVVLNGTRYMSYAATGEPFFKAGADAPENMLAFNDFDATPNAKGLRKSWEPHLQDAEGIDLEKYGWNGKGAGILGAVKYLHDQGMNAVSFLTFNVAGDDQNVFPHLMKVSIDEYEAYEDIQEQWKLGVDHLRFDVSKMDQWQRVLSFGNDLGMFLHFKLQETENDNLMDGGGSDIERVAYLRQIIARHAHFLALNWNIGEENNRSSEHQIAMAQAIDDLDPYDHLRVMHTYSQQKFRYIPLLGENSSLTGASLQGMHTQYYDTRSDVAEWILRSAAAGKPWVVSYDEPGRAQFSIGVDATYPDVELPKQRNARDDRKTIRGQVLWGTMTGGGTGVEYYYGYDTGCSDLTCQDHRTRASKWEDAKFTLDFFREKIGKKVFDMEPINVHSGKSAPFIFGELGQTYVIYAHNGDPISLKSGIDEASYKVEWYDPVSGERVDEITLKTKSDTGYKRGHLDIPAAPRDHENDWVLLVEKIPS